MAIDPGLREAIMELAKQTGLTPEQVCNLPFAEIEKLRDETQARADEANARIAWAEAGLAVLDDPGDKPCIRCGYRLEPSTDADVHEVCVDPTRVEVDPVLAEVAHCPDCRISEVIVVPSVDEDGEPGLLVTVSHDVSCPALARRRLDAE